MMKRKITIYTLLCLLFVCTFSCRDDLYIDDERIGEGECVISGTVKFKPFIPTLNGNSRSAGDAIKAIKSLCVLLYDEGKNLVNKYPVENYIVTNVDRKNENRTESIGGEDKTLSSAESETPHATFRLTVPYGKYYIYAIANMGDLSEHNDAIQTIEGLKNISLRWNKDDMGANNQMFGHFFSDARSDEAPLLTISKQSEKLQAWIRRAASKVTVAFDGSSLREGVSIYIKSLRIKNIPDSCRLGVDNTVKNEKNLIETGEEVVYCESMSYDPNYPALITKDLPFYPRKADGDKWVMDPDAHSEDNLRTLFFYENMQGTGPDKRQFDGNKDGILDSLYRYETKPYATYIEVDAYYVSINPERPGVCNITYRFMLGQDVIKDYDAKRNCHYKLTLHFNGYADDPDWRIDYVTRLWATQPETVDYRGKYFVPDNISSNQGNNFSDTNIITVTSFMYQNDDWYKRNPVAYKIEYKDAGSTQFTATRPDWLDEFETTHKGSGVYKLKIKYKNRYKQVNINDTLSKIPAKSGIYDLSTKRGSESMNTANCYIVDSRGTYQFPLVYGNAITNGKEYSASYTYQGWGTSANYLKIFKNYNDGAINSPYILDDIYGRADKAPDLTASLVWQDEPDLVTGIKYVADVYNGKGGIQFTVGSKIKEGNAVIALKDPSGTIMWSWHIWVTAMDLSRKITLTNADAYGNRNFEIMSVNLGWCSGGIPIRYYERHECEVRFTQLISGEGQEGLSKIVKIIQEPHIALPCGNNPYFQWGRKDPFIAGGSKNETTKTWYDAGGNPQTAAPALMYAEEEHRVPTYQATADLIRNPDKWQNCPHKSPGDWGNKYKPSDNENIFFNLWDNNDDLNDVVKTIYDPCPAGYHVSSLYTFSGFTDSGGSITDGAEGAKIEERMYAVIEKNMLVEGNNTNYKDNIFEFYTNKTKLISIGFPQNGYRDWDANAVLFQYGQGEIWHAQAATWEKYLAYHLEFSRATTQGFSYHIFPWNNFYATDGFAVRPSKTL